MTAWVGGGLRVGGVVGLGVRGWGVVGGGGGAVWGWGWVGPSSPVTRAAERRGLLFFFRGSQFQQGLLGEMALRPFKVPGSQAVRCSPGGLHRQPADSLDAGTSNE